MAKERPIGVTILAILAFLGAFNAFIYTLQMLHLLPTYIGPVTFWQFSLIGIPLTPRPDLARRCRDTPQLHPQGWNFMMLISAFTLVFGFLSILGGLSWESMATIMI